MNLKLYGLYNLRASRVACFLWPYGNSLTNCVKNCNQKGAPLRGDAFLF